MRKQGWIYFYCLWFVLIGMSFGQETKSDSVKDDSFLKKGSKSLLFQINENFTISDFQGALLSMKCHFTEKSAIRIGLSVGGHYIYSHDNRSYSQIDSAFYDMSNIVDTNIEIGLTTQYIRYSRRGSNVKLFYAIGPVFNYHLYNINYSQVKTKKTEVPYKYDIGILLDMGVEWFISKNVSLVAEYGFLSLYSHEQWIEGYTTQVAYSEGVIDSFEFYPSIIKFGISLYFQ